MDLVNDIIDDLTSRQALAGAASVVYIAAFVIGWWWWTRRVRLRRRNVDCVVLVTGSRGKSSTVRALHAALSEAGWPTYAKTTGTAAAELAVDGSESPTRRIGRVGVLEVLRTLDRALDSQPRALVFECMAVKPDLIALIADEMLDPDISIITNAQVDHLEDEGSDLAEIAASLAKAIRPSALVVTGESDAGALHAIRQAAIAHGARLAATATDALPGEIRTRLPFVHPQNVTFVLEVTRHLGIDDETAIRGMERSSKEPGELEIWRREMGGLDVAYVDFGATNDPASVLSALDAFVWPLPRSVPRIALVTGRWDRPYRDLSFVGILDRDRFDALVLTGGPVHMMRRELLRRGWPAERVAISTGADRRTRVRTHRVTRLVRSIDPTARQAMLIGLENEHDPIADRHRSFFHLGLLVEDRAARKAGA